MTEAELINKYHYEIIDGLRLYPMDMTLRNKQIDFATPYYFSCPKIEILNRSWGLMMVDLVNKLDELYPKSNKEKLNFKLDWTKVPIFSETNKANHKLLNCGLYLNTNRNSSLSFKQIQDLIIFYKVKLTDCKLLYDPKYLNEPKEVYKFYRDVRYENLKYFELNSLQRKEEYYQVDLKNISVLNRYLNVVSPSHNDLLMFPKLVDYQNGKIKIMEYLNKKYLSSNKILAISKRLLDRLEEFYKLMIN